ncbi:helix-turn-helix domain-containing protein [Danxiaibacter flavus]|uniref:Helix-turn-helix domain-containing protein n=1 Tax=Danxiaibacter flavus TaxID=3049108 RepID=A0ABV3ZKE4_9BACT|nr:helix-turn-helix domain-containing protein [Chitinophagaceae bacterium DXS]
MKQVSLLIYEDAILSCISGPLDLLTGVNQFLEEQGKRPAFKIELVSEKLKNIQLIHPAQFICYKNLSDVQSPDLIIVPSFYGQAVPVLEKNKAIINWIREKYVKGAEVASLCQGSYFLAEAGLLSGRSCTSHWMAMEDMKNRYPDISLQPDKVITDNDGIYTSGGAFSSLNLILYLIEKFCGREACVWMSKMFSIDMDKLSQAHFAVFQSQRKHNDEAVLLAQDYIEKNFHLPISVDEISEKACMSKRNFIRRFRTATRNNPLEYLQRVRIESAKKALENSEKQIQSLMYDVGYNDMKSFRTIFRRITGLSPQEYRRKYARVENIVA